jgi:hypothetical protein
MRDKRGFEQKHTTIMHDYARLDTIMHDLRLRFLLRCRYGGQESFHLRSGGRSYGGRDGGQGAWPEGFIANLAFFAYWSHKIRFGEQDIAVVRGSFLFVKPRFLV